MATNYSVYSIPVFFIMNFIPHAYAAMLFTGGSPKRFDNVNPKSSATLERFRKRASAATFTRWERANAAHHNGYENLPLLVAAVVLGNMARLDAATMNWTFGTFLALRAVFIYAYINTESQKWSALRSVVFIITLLQCLWIIMMAGNVLAN
ncbi:MAG: hypothetical protein Q9177_002642 [Variospora cf. flavescens]